mmetsp:Transcript_87463/g.152614  ORF Transcript_87463/g.152614 Transcript_87463/m.152614 type:complete len:499 (-) Transcript_87463:45-1541(-)
MYAIVLASLAWSSHGRRLNMRSQQEQRDPEQAAALKAFARHALAGVEPAAGWHLSASSHKLSLPHCSGKCAGLRPEARNLVMADSAPGATVQPTVVIDDGRVSPGKKPKSFPDQSAELALVEWIRSNGGFVGSVNIDTRNGLRGLFVTKDVLAGELLLVIPKSCILSAEEDPKSGLSLTELMTARLVETITRGKNREQIESWPRQPDPVLHEWTPSELQHLQSPKLAAGVAAIPQLLRQSHEKLLPFVKAEWPTVMWADRMVRSRAFVFDEGWQGKRSMCMVPLVDFVNHRLLPTVGKDVFLDIDEQVVKLIAPEPLKAGDEVRITYKRNGNEKLLLDYGFAELLAPEQPSSEALHLDSLEPGCPLRLGSDELDEGALTTLRQQVARRDQREAIKGDPALDRAVCEALLGICKAQLDRMPTSEADDRRSLSDIESSPPPDGMHVDRWRDALIFRIGQKWHLSRMVQVLSYLLSGGECSHKEVCDYLHRLRSFEMQISS